MYETGVNLLIAHLAVYLSSRMSGILALLSFANGLSEGQLYSVSAQKSGFFQYWRKMWPCGPPASLK